MGLYLCVFDEADEDEHAASEVGSYADFNAFREAVARYLVGSDDPVLLLHSDCDGEWTVEELPALIKELDVIAAALSGFPEHCMYPRATHRFLCHPMPAPLANATWTSTVRSSLTHSGTWLGPGSNSTAPSPSTKE